MSTHRLEGDRPFFNREWSWLRFNERVLEEAEDSANPLLERLKFISIFSSNLDEFFMVRVAGLHRLVDAGMATSGADKRRPATVLDGIHKQVHLLVRRQEEALFLVMSELEREGISFVGMNQLDRADRAFAKRYYEDVVYPVLTPMIVGPKHPFPMLQSCNLCIVVRLHDARKRTKRSAHEPAGRRRVGFVAVPKVLPRFLRVNAGEGQGIRFVPLESIIVEMMPQIFSGYRVIGVNAVRVTRDADIRLDEEAEEDMRRAMARKLRGRRHGAGVRLEHGSRLDGSVIELLAHELELKPAQFFPHRGLMQHADLMQIYGALERPALKDEIVPSVTLHRSRDGGIFEWIRRAPRLVHHPYHTFDPVAEFVTEAAIDPAVLAIKQTLYRTSGDSPVIRALVEAAENGKSVTVVVELRARFDEERNIEWAHRLEKAGAHVVYGLVGYKTHCKALLVVRRDADGIRRYVHLGTGNYNDATARVYTDVGLFSADESLGEDISALFNVITGATEPPRWNKVEMSPTGMKSSLLAMIRREAEKGSPQQPGRIIAKMNSLVDLQVIEALYGASQAGVRIDLIVRGICCLRPGVEQISENIQVTSIVGRYLEHSRIFWFQNGGQEELYLSSADWMPRNLDRRVELLFPVEDLGHRSYLKEVLALQLADTVKARRLLPDGSYERVGQGRKRQDCQVEIHELTQRCSDSGPSKGPLRFAALPRGARLRSTLGAVGSGGKSGRDR